MTQFNPRKTYRILFVFILLLSTGNLFSQKKGAKPTIHEGITQTVPSLVILDASQQYSTKNSKQIFKEIFHLSSENRFTKVKVNKGKGDYVHEKHQQFFKDIKVEGGISTLHTQNGLVTSISSELYRIDNSFNSNPSLSANEAFNLAIEHTDATTYLWEDAASAEELGYEKPVGELVILPTFNGDDTILKLAYKFEIFTLVPMGGGDLYMDANSGEALFFNNRVKHYDTIGHDGSSYEKVAIATCEEEPRQNTTESLVAATAATRYSGTRTIETRNEGANYSLNYDANQIYTRNAYNQGPGNGVPPYIANYTEFLDTDNNWTAGEFHNANKDDAALDAHWGAMMVYDYWNAEHGRDSYDGAGSQIRSYVHVDTDYDNAFWYYNTMSYGDGSGNSNPGSGLFDALTCLDVAAHELGHGVTEYTANLAYQRESGGMNEGFSDIWGAAIEHFAKGTGTDANPDANVWAIGEEIMRNGSASLRSMSNPKSQGQPDTYGGTYWINPNCGTPTDANDYCGVHTNSGVLNHWFYLVTVGGSGTNDVADTYNVTGIGMTKASTIAYDVLDNYLGANSTYADARDFSIQSATVLYGDCSQELVTITDAWHAVGVGAVYSGGAPSLTLSASTTCVTSGTTTLSGGTATGGVYSGLGVTDDGNGTTFTFDPTVAGVGTHTITYTRACGAGSASDTDTIEVTDGLPVLICKDISVTLDGGGDISITASDVVSNLEYDTTSYTLDTSGTFSPETITGTTLSLGDDAGSSLLPIGFDFDFYGTTYSNFYIASNGFISFDNDGTSGAVSYTPTALADGGAPNNMIALVWDDLSPNQSGTIKYETIGIAPNRKLIVDFIDVPLYTASPPSAYEVTSQLQLFEGSQRIEIHTSKATSGGTSRTQGIENATGTAATPTTGRNLANWSLPDGSSDYVAYVPSNTGSIVDNCGNPVTLSVNKTDFTCKDIGDVTVTITADDGNGGISTCDATVTVVGPTTVFTGSWDNGTPNSTKKAIFSNNYSTSVADIDACVCEITNNAIITVGAGEYMKVDGNITVDAGSSLMIQHEGSVVQGDDSAIVSNNGSITVEKITPTLAEKTFMIMGSPMTSETREDVYNTAYIVRHHNTANFVPNPDVAAAFPSAENFADDNGNNWLTHTGGLAPAEGYMVFPQPNTTGSGSFTHNYTQGTLNNGVIAYPLVYHTDQNSSPNILSNPYASAIDADAFYADAANTAIDVLYFWEHITPLSLTYPGYNPANFSMGDISMYSEVMGGIPAANGGTTPNSIIASGQGFGVKAASAGITATFNNAMRVTGPNDTYRRPMASERDRLWINVYNDSYGLGSTTLIGFSENTTATFEANADIKRLATPVSLYSELATGEELAINALGTFEVEASVGLSFSTQVKESQNYRISLQDVDGLHIETATVYLIDTLTGSVTNLSEGDYTFQSGEATYSERFKVVFQNQILGTNDITLDAVSVYPNPTQNIVYVASPKAAITNTIVYDAQGRRVLSVKNVNTTNAQIDLSTLTSALYFVEITTEAGVVTKRIVKK